MKITVNNEIKDLTPGTTVEELVESLYQSAGGIAVAVNGKLVKKPEHQAFVLQEGDDIVIIKAAYGG